MPLDNLDGVVTGTIENIHSVIGSVSGAKSVSGIVVISGDVTPAYSGEYEITPSENEQILETSGKKMLGNVIIAPIPQNYGLITWNGATLTVS